MRARYQVTKLFNVFFTRALSSRLSSSTPLIATSTNPGFCYSELRRDSSFPISTISKLAEKVFAFTTEEGSRQLVYAALGGKDDPDKMRGAYVSMGAVQEVSDYVLGEEGGKVQERIWVSSQFVIPNTLLIQCLQNETIDILVGMTPKVREVVDRYLSVAY